MSFITAHVSCPVHPSFRVAQVRAMFDLPANERSEETFAMELPDLHDPRDWRIGAIVGPSGSGKTTLAKAAYGDAVYSPQPWPTDRAVIDAFGDGSIHEITHLLTAVGLGSPPAWLRPYHVLSNGERFRCDLARAIVCCASKEWREGGGVRGYGCAGDKSGMSDPPHSATPVPPHPLPLLVFDEFTSVVDRTVAQVASAAIGKAIRSGRIRCRLVAVTCHRDILPWLAPDWVADTATGQLTWGRLQRPNLRLTVRRVPQSLWKLFARHHYLSGDLNSSATCWAAFGGAGVEGTGVRGCDEASSSPAPPYSNTPTPISFCAVVSQFGWKGRKRIARLVTLPDYQGLGIGMRLLERVCEHESARGFAISITASHPALLAACRRSPRWRCTQFKPHGHNRRQVQERRVATSHGRCVATFEWRANDEIRMSNE